MKDEIFDSAETDFNKFDLSRVNEEKETMLAHS